MKHVKNLTRDMKYKLIRLKLNPNNWQYIKNTPQELVLVHRVSGKTRVISNGDVHS